MQARCVLPILFSARGALFDSLRFCAFSPCACVSREIAEFKIFSCLGQEYQAHLQPPWQGCLSIQLVPAVRSMMVCPHAAHMPDAITIHSHLKHLRHEKMHLFFVP